MALAGSEIFSPANGQHITFRKTAAETGGALMEMESVHKPHGPVDTEHVHPNQVCRINILSGNLHFKIDGNTRVYGAGDTIEIPKNTPHSFWNEGDEPVHEIQQYEPALNIEDFFVTYFALAREGKLGANGLPNLLQLAVLMQAYDNAIRVTSTPVFVQKLVMWTLGPVGRLFGYKPVIQ